MVYAKIVQASPACLELAVKYLKEGKLVAFPSETVYGLGALATSVDALNLLYKVKGRPQHHPVIVHLANLKDIDQWVSQWPNIAQTLADNFWPGPMTLILPKANNVLNQVTGGQDSIAIRIPRNKIALELLELLGTGIAAPSANRFGRISATSAQAVFKELGNKVELIIDNGHSPIGLESTIINLYQKPYQIMRPGMLMESDIRKVLSPGQLAEFSVNDTTNNLRVSGNLKSHYQPITPLKLMTQSEIINYINNHPQVKIGIIAFTPIKSNSNQVNLIKASSDVHDYAQNLYARIRQLDESGLAIILIEQTPITEDWLAINDRLAKASFKD